MRFKKHKEKIEEKSNEELKDPSIVEEVDKKINSDETNVLLVVGLISLFIFPLAGIVILIIVLSRKHKDNKKKKLENKDDKDIND